MKKTLLTIIFTLFQCSIFAQDSPQKDEDEKPPKIGNFALPTAQQVNSLFGFGGNIIDEGNVQLSLFVDEFAGSKRFISEVYPYIVFGVTDTFSLLFAAPFYPRLRTNDNISNGIEDWLVQAEYAFYSTSTKCAVNQATLVAGINVPTGSTRKNPNTGYGSPSFFLGATFYRTTIDWVFWLDPGALLTTSYHGTKYGDQYLYQCGIARNLPSPPGWIYAFLIDIDGQYARKNRIKGDLDPNSGGNYIFVTPSLWMSSEHFILQFGVGFPITQNAFGNQGNFDYAVLLNTVWTFY